MSPSIGVLKDDIKLSQFEGIKSQNVTKSTPEVLENAPIEVVDYSVDGGILTIQYKENKGYLNEKIGTYGSAHVSLKHSGWLLCPPLLLTRI